MKSRLVLFLVVVSALSFSASAQAPSADWRSIETEHFRFHFPAPFEDWTRAAAEKMESVRSEVVAVVGYAPDEKIDVLVMDPFAEANGSAWPVLGRARIILWTSAPGPESQIGNYSDFVELLTVHEETHIVHLLRPSRNPLGKLYASLLPVGPIALRAPRWVTEGYATVVEGELTGSGRPNSALRASILRLWAQSGRLPNYSQMSSDSQSWMGMSMAYLMGSAYLEWLQQQKGEDSLRKLWARMTARHGRSFDEAFAGVFGERPRPLYDRFTAELTYRALSVEKERRPSLREGELWQAFRWTTGAPQVSAGSDRLLTIVGGHDDPPVLSVFSTAPDTKAEERYQKRIASMIEKDPQDVAPLREKPLPREPLNEMTSLDGSPFISPRWIGSDAVLYEQPLTDSIGVFHPDLFRWNLLGRNSERLTQGADLREADPFPDGSSVVAVRQRFGKSQLVRLDLKSENVVALTDASVRDVYSWPRVSPDGERVVYVVHRDRGWNLAVMELSMGEEHLLEAVRQTFVAQPAWSHDGKSIYVAVGRHGFIDIERVSLDGSSAIAITRSQGAALAPAPSPDGRWVYFLSLTADGLDVRRIPVDTELPPLPELTYLPEEFPVAGSMSSSPRTFSLQILGPSRPYGAGRQEFSLLHGGNAAAGAHNYELGVRVGDVVGRLETIAVGSFFGERGPRGGAAATTWRGWPVSVGAHLFSAKERFSKSIEQEGLATSERGVELRAGWDRRWRSNALDISAGVLAQQLKTDASFDERSFFLGAGLDGAVPRGRWSIPYSVGIDAQRGTTEGDSWTRGVLHAEGGINFQDNGLSVGYRRGSSSGISNSFDRFLIGGISSTIIPESAWANRLLVPALEPGTLIGEEFEDQKISMTTSLFPLRPFYERVRVWNEAGSEGEWLSLAGLELEVSSGNLAVLQLPAIGIRLGVARILDEPLRNRTRWWIGLTYRP